MFFLFWMWQVRLRLEAVFCCVFLPFGSVSAQTSTGGGTLTAADTGVDIIAAPLGASTADIRVVIARVVQVALGFLGTVMFVLIIYSGWLWMSAGGNSEQIDKAKKILSNSIIGLVIILSAYGITVFIIRALVDGTGASSTDTGGAASTFVADNFSGSGSLGVVLKDHYPSREQSDVPRNTKIVITFRRPIKLDSFVTNTNNSICIVTGKQIGRAHV